MLELEPVTAPGKSLREIARANLHNTIKGSVTNDNHSHLSPTPFIYLSAIFRYAGHPR